MENDYDLPEILAGIIITLALNPELGESDLTIDDFFDFVRVPPEDRSDYVWGILYAQALVLSVNANIHESR